MAEQPPTEHHFTLTLGGGPSTDSTASTTGAGGLRGIRNGLTAFFRGSTPNHLHLRERLVFLWGATLALDLVFSVLAYLLESGKPQSDLHNYGDALFWTTTQLLTISSQLSNPVTGWGMVLDVVMEFLGITLITAQAGALGSFLYRHSMERSPIKHSIEGTAQVTPVDPASGPEAS